MLTTILDGWVGGRLGGGVGGWSGEVGGWIIEELGNTTTSFRAGLLI